MDSFWSSYIIKREISVPSGGQAGVCSSGLLGPMVADRGGVSGHNGAGNF